MPRGEREAVAGEMLEGFVRYLEQMCFRSPYQWFNWYDFWAEGG